jgi:hypothetical protein
MIGADGKSYTVPATSVDKALKNGWHLATEEETNRAGQIKNRLHEQEEHPIATAADTFSNEALLGVPHLIRDYKNPDAEDKAVNEDVESRFAEAHPVQHYGAKAAGFGTGLLIPGVGEVGEAAEGLVRGGAKLAEEEVGKVAAESLARKVAGKATKYAAEGALYSAPQAAVQAAYGDKESAAETMLWGVGLSGALGAGSELVGSGVKAAAGKIGDIGSDLLNAKEANGMSKIDNVRRRVLDITDKDANKMAPGQLMRVIERADQEGIVAADPREKAALVQNMLKDSGAKLGEHMDSLEQLLDDPELAKHGPVPTSTANKFQAEIIGKMPDLKSELYAPHLEYAQKIEKAIAEGGADPSFKKLQEVRKRIQGFTKSFEKQSVNAEIGRFADSVINRDLEESAQKLYEGGNLPEKFADYLSQNERYEAGKTLMKGVNLHKNAGKLGGGSIGLKTMGQIFFGVMTGHPLLFGANIARETATKAFLENKYGLLGKSVSFLAKVAKDPATAPFIGGFMAKEGASALSSHISSLPAYLHGDRVITHSGTEAIQHWIGPIAGLSKQQQYDKLSDAIVKAQTETQTTAQRVGALASTFTGTDVQLATMVAQKKLTALSYLQNAIPKNPRPPVPFQRDEWKPTRAQQQQFLDTVSVVQNPMVAVKRVAEGTVTRNDRETLKAVYPSIYRQMVEKVVQMAYDPKAKPLDHTARMRLSMFTGLPLDRSAKNMTAIQGALNDAGQQPQQQGGVGPKPSSRPHMKTPSLQTDAQRRESGGASK